MSLPENCPLIVASEQFCDTAEVSHCLYKPPKGDFEYSRSCQNCGRITIKLVHDVRTYETLVDLGVPVISQEKEFEQLSV